MSAPEQLPVIVIGAGPVGLAAAARLAERGISRLILEAGPSAGTSLKDWGHVRVFSPWEYNIDPAARSLLDDMDWSAPDPQELPTGEEIVRKYLDPLATHPAIAPALICSATVMAISRKGLGKVASTGRDQAPFVVRWRDKDGQDRRTLAKAVIDASGSWDQPNPIGIDGLPVAGELSARDRIAYGIPDVLGARRQAYAGKHVLVIGGGHSAINVVLDLLRLHDAVPGTRVSWALRGNRIDKLLGGGLNDQLPQRGALGIAAKQAIEAKRLNMLTSFAVERIDRTNDGLSVSAQADGDPAIFEVDRIVVATGFRPNLNFLRELRIALDPAVESPPALAPLIDPNLHSCGTVPPHGAAELAHPEHGFYIVGSKSYGRAPTFLMATGYEQVRSVVAEIAGDHAAARDVRLSLPETGVCRSAPIAAGLGPCCDRPAAFNPSADRCCGTSV